MVGSGFRLRCPFLLEEGLAVEFGKCLAGEVVEIPLTPGLADTLVVVVGGVSCGGLMEALRRERGGSGRGGKVGGAGLTGRLRPKSFPRIVGGILCGQRAAVIPRSDVGCGAAWRGLNDQFARSRTPTIPTILGIVSGASAC